MSRLAGGLLGLAALALVSPARAQTNPTELEARALFEAGEGAVGERRFEDARRLFERSLELHPTPAAAFNAAVAAQEMDDLPAAATHLDRLLAGRYGELPAGRAERVRDLLERLTSRIAVIELRAEDPYVELSIDGRDVESSGTHYVAPGRHALVVRTPSRAPRRREVEVEAGERRTFDLLLEVEVERSIAPPAGDEGGEARPWWSGGEASSGEPGAGTERPPNDGPDVGLIVGLTIAAVLAVGAGIGVGVAVDQAGRLPDEFVGSTATLNQWRFD